MSDPTDSRKSEVVDLLRADPATDRARHWFDEVRLRHRALPELDLGAVDPSTTFLGKRLSFPLLISSMTGGAAGRLRRVNRRLAAAAEACGVAMGVGSQRVMFTHPAARASFELRDVAPRALLFANLGAVQLNYGFGLRECAEAVRAVGADALYLHLNPLQEAVQPEGNRDFAGLAAKIGRVAERLPVPVVLKEVGAGLSREDVRRAAARGVRIFDVAGSGGTSWARIEQHRAAAAGGRGRLGFVYQDWGWPTPLALRELAPLRGRVTLIASGGLRTGLDLAKALVLGAELGGVAGPFLPAALRSKDAVVELIEQLRAEFTTAMFLLGVRRVADLVGNGRLLLDAGGGAARRAGRRA